MNTLALRPCAAVAFAAAAIMPLAAAQAGPNPKIGTKIRRMYPDFVLPRLGGGMERLSDHRGKKVLLINFASW